MEEDKELRKLAQSFMSEFDNTKLFTHEAVEDIVYSMFKAIKEKAVRK